MDEIAMAMNIGSGGDEDEVVSTINTTPLVDVMLVLLIIFLITIPVVTQTVPLHLPKETNMPRQTKPENIEISVNRMATSSGTCSRSADNDALFQAPEGGRGDEAAARGAHPRRRRRPATNRSGACVFACQRAAIRRSASSPNRHRRQ